LKIVNTNCKYCEYSKNSKLKEKLFTFKERDFLKEENMKIGEEHL